MAGPETTALVALLRLGRRPWPQYAELVERHGSALALIERELAEADDGQISLLSASSPDDIIERAGADVAGWEANGIRLVTVLDPDYPTNLRAVHDRPPLLFVAGALDPTDAHSIAVVGTRDPSPAAVEGAQAIAGHLADRRYTVISGLATGIDTAAHTATLAKRSRTIAVIGSGLAHSYPPQNATLQRTIATRGAVVSQFWPEMRPSRRSFPMRNGVMSGLSLGTVVVEASETSGARVQARLALAHGRPVFLAASVLAQAWARALAARPGTTVFTHPSEVTSVIERLDHTGALVA